MGYDKFNAGGSPVTVLRQWCVGGGGGGGGVEILLVTLCYRYQDKLWPDVPLGLCAVFLVRFYIRF